MLSSYFISQFDSASRACKIFFVVTWKVNDNLLCVIAHDLWNWLILHDNTSNTTTSRNVNNVVFMWCRWQGLFIFLFSHSQYLVSCCDEVRCCEWRSGELSVTPMGVHFIQMSKYAPIVFYAEDFSNWNLDNSHT